MRPAWLLARASCGATFEVFEVFEMFCFLSFFEVLQWFLGTPARSATQKSTRNTSPDATGEVSLAAGHCFLSGLGRSPRASFLNAKRHNAGIRVSLKVSSNTTPESSLCRSAFQTRKTEETLGNEATIQVRSGTCRGTTWAVTAEGARAAWLAKVSCGATFEVFEVFEIFEVFEVF